MSRIKSTQIHETKALTSGQAVTIQIPPYGVIQNLMLYFTTSGGVANAIADIKSEISNIRLTVNGKDMVNASPTHILEMIESFSNSLAVPSGNAGIVELNLGSLIFNNPDVRENFALGTADVSTIQVTVTAGTLTNVANVQGISTRFDGNRVMGAFAKLIDYPQSFNATGKHTVDTLPRNPTSAYISILTDNGASGVISSGEMRVNNITIMEDVDTAINKAIQSNNRYAVPTGSYLYCLNDKSDGAILPMAGVTDLRLITEFSTAPGVGGYTHTALTVENIKLK